MSKLVWNEENTNALEAKAKALSADVVSQEHVATIAAELSEETGKDVSTRSIGSKLRKLGYSVQKANEAVKSAWSDEQEAELVAFLTNYAGAYTYAEVAAAVAGGTFTAKQVQGKILSLELHGSVKPTERTAPARTFSVDEEAKFISLAAQGKSIEEIAVAFDKTVKQTRGKALSLLREGRIQAIPSQSESAAKAREDVLEGLDIESMIVSEIAEATGKSERGVKSMLSRRGLVAKDYDGAAKRQKLDDKAAK
ncbi:putative D5 protein [Pectobacterium phage DU_PP_V]|uniref:Putative D5 protein n=1 Tax=Pectobacterium phage DU_PP_V TaxID=2041492 RepID=A0A2D2W703_9CAUD|nr:putative D5 protein [Pectobacterium phage DU_PP_V]ATS94077.1 putative D5 protein [Pectobacterium phage DU_PP_V]